MSETKNMCYRCRNFTQYYLKKRTAVFGGHITAGAACSIRPFMYISAPVNFLRRNRRKTDLTGYKICGAAHVRQTVYASQRKRYEKACKLRAPAYSGARIFPQDTPRTVFICKISPKCLTYRNLYSTLNTDKTDRAKRRSWKFV